MRRPLGIDGRRARATHDTRKDQLFNKFKNQIPRELAFREDLSS